MPFRSVNNILITSAFESDLASMQEGIVFKYELFPSTMSAIKEEFPSLSHEGLVKLVGLLLDIYKKEEKEKVELVVTAPPSFKLKTSSTEDIVFKLLSSANKSIIITGYSISDYVGEYIDLIVRKSQNGVLVKIYFNNLDKQESIDKLIRYRGRFLEIYDYRNKDDEMSALHAKVISVDGLFSLISSANLSYHGMSGNMEIGCLIESTKIAKKINEILKQLVAQKVITRKWD